MLINIEILYAPLLLRNHSSGFTEFIVLIIRVSSLLKETGKASTLFSGHVGRSETSSTLIPNPGKQQ